MPHEQPTNDGLNSPSPLSVTVNVSKQNKMNQMNQMYSIDHDLDEADNNCFESESVP